jgi:hypothetical protein
MEKSAAAPRFADRIVVALAGRGCAIVSDEADPRHHRSAPPAPPTFSRASWDRNRPEAWAQTVVVDNRPERAARSARDRRESAADSSLAPDISEL